jgi:hypothetical protein
MGQRREGRKTVQVPVRIFGTDSRGKPFSENVSSLNLSQTGVLLCGVMAELKSGETVGLSYGPNKAQFSVKVGKPGTPQEHQVGLLNITTEKPIWDFQLPAGTIDPHGRNVPAGERRASPRLKCMNSVELHRDEQSSPILGKVVELCIGGCFIEMPMPLRQGAKLKIGMWIQENKIWVRAKVVSSRPEFGIGLQFTEIADPDKEALRAFLRGISNLRYQDSNLESAAVRRRHLHHVGLQRTVRHNLWRCRLETAFDRRRQIQVLDRLGNKCLRTQPGRPKGCSRILHARTHDHLQIRAQSA